MLSFFTDPYPDELLYSVFARYHFYSGNINLMDTLKELFGKNSVTPSFEIGSHLNFLCDSLGGDYKPEELIQKNTLFPYYAPFMPSERKFAILDNISSGNIIHAQMGISLSGHICKKDNIHYCSICASEDIENFGESYIHREHQLEGVMVCPHHERLLKKYPKRIRERSYIEYVRLDGELLDLSDTCQLQNKYQDKLLQISKAAYYLLSQDLSCFSKSDVLLQYKNLLYEMNLTTYNNLRVKRDELHDMVIDHYGTELLEFLESDIDKNNTQSWLRNATRGAAKMVHPLRHILLILFLVGDMDTFFKQIGKKYTPFGEGPWPCLNIASDHYWQDVINQITVTANSETRKPLGTFVCTCGYIYARTGPDKTKSDRYLKSRCKAFGHVWEDRLKMFLNEGCHSYYKIGLELGCSTRTILRFIEKFKEENPIGIDKNKQKIVESQLSKKKMYTERVLYIIKENPELTRTEIIKKCKKEVSFLYYYDKKLLLKVLPAKRTPKGGKSDVDWDKRDREVLLELQYAHIEMLNREKAIRITKSSLSKAIFKLYLLQNYMNKLPCCADFIDTVSETVQQFQLRRCKIIIMEMKKTGLPLNGWRVKNAAHLRKKHYECIKDKIELMLYDNQ